MDQDASNYYDLIIIGAGPAGLTAGIYAARAALKALLIEGTSTLSQISNADHVENYPGFPEGISGFELTDRLKKQAVQFGLEIVSGDVSDILITTLEKPSGRRVEELDGWEIKTDGASYKALSCIIATGASWKKMGIPGENELVGKGVSYCATCDAPFYRDKDIVVVGGGDTAVGEAVYLTRFARKITIVHRRDRLRACSLLQKRAFENKKIEVIWDVVPERILGEDRVVGIQLRSTKTSAPREIAAEGVFILIGLNPNTGFAREVVTMDEGGYILVDADMKASAPGIFACGDCIHKNLRQVVTACGDGAVAAFSAQTYLEEMKGVF
jgi:thioredoxin reductase (NADPH)